MSFLIETLKLIPMPNNKTNFLESTYKVSLDQAAWFVYAFLRQPELYRIATQEAIGGTIRKNSLKEDAGMVYLGSMGWFCRNVERPGKPENPDFPKLFMAFEDAQYNIHDVPHMPAGDDPIP